MPEPPESQYDENHPYFDEKHATRKDPWSVVHVAFREKFEAPVTLKDLQKHAKEDSSPLKDMQVLRMSRLSVSRVSRPEWEFVLSLAAVNAKASQKD